MTEQYDFISGAFVDKGGQPDNPVVKEDLTPDNDQRTFEGERFTAAHHNVLAHLIEQDWNKRILFSGRLYGVLELAAHVGRHTPIGNLFVEQVSGINQMD